MAAHDPEALQRPGQPQSVLRFAQFLESIQRGRHCILEGLVEGLPDGRSGSFISSLSLDDDGRIERYVSFYCEPSVARR